MTQTITGGATPNWNVPGAVGDFLGERVCPLLRLPGDWGGLMVVDDDDVVRWRCWEVVDVRLSRV